MPGQLRVMAQGGMIGDLLRSHLTQEVQLRLVSSLNDDDVAGHLAEADVWVSGRFTAGMAAQATRLRLVQTTGVGTDNVDFAALPPMASVCNVHGHATGVAEYVFMAMLSLLRGVIGMDQRIRAGDWTDRNFAAPQPELRGRTLGLMGLGAIGEEVARLALAFGMNVQAIAQNPDTKRAQNLGLSFLGDQSDLHFVLSSADFVVLAVPLTEQTREMIGPEELRIMKPSAYLVNVARGAVVSEAALYEALRERSIGGAAVDVWYRYPAGSEQVMPSLYPFHELDNVIMTPHVAGWTDGTIRTRIRQIDENLRRLRAGEPLMNLVFQQPAKSRE